MNTLSRCGYGLALVVASGLMVGWGWDSGAKTTPAAQYRLELLHRTAHSFNPNFDDGEESLRVESIMMGTSTHPKLVRWRKDLDQLRDKPPLEQLQAVNRLINGDVVYRSDYEHWKRQDKWGFPYATLDEGGDCEDFAMLKRVSLRYLGWPPEGVFLLMGYSTINGKPETHALLMVTAPDGQQYLLDSAQKRVLTPAQHRSFKPMMALEREHLYMVSSGGRA